jgi:hypothetical protein
MQAYVVVRTFLWADGFAAPEDNLTVDHKALGQAALAHNSTSPNSTVVAIKTYPALKIGAKSVV